MHLINNYTHLNKSKKVKKSFTYMFKSNSNIGKIFIKMSQIKRLIKEFLSVDSVKVVLCLYYMP